MGKRLRLTNVEALREVLLSLQATSPRKKRSQAALNVRLRVLRKQRQLTQVQLAKSAKITQSNLSQLEANNSRFSPSLPVLKRLAKALGVSVGELL